MAMKMRAAMTHKFGRDFGLGTQPWMEHPMKADHFLGNPSISTTVTQYMVSLNRRKVRSFTSSFPSVSDSYDVRIRSVLVK